MPKETLTGWSMFQAKLTNSAPRVAAGDRSKNELLTYGDPSYKPSAGRAISAEATGQPEEGLPQESEFESALFAYISDKAERDPEPAGRSKPLAAQIVCSRCGDSRLRPAVIGAKASSTLAGDLSKWAPEWQPVAEPSTSSSAGSRGPARQFRAVGGQYKLPTPANIPDATTDPRKFASFPWLTQPANSRRMQRPIPGRNQRLPLRMCLLNRTELPRVKVPRGPRSKSKRRLQAELQLCRSLRQALRLTFLPPRRCPACQRCSQPRPDFRSRLQSMYRPRLTSFLQASAQVFRPV